MKASARLPNIWQGLRLITIVWLCAIVATTTPAISQTKPLPRSKNSLKIRWKPPIPPSLLGIPGNRAQGGATRGCQPYRDIAALVPKSPQQVAWGRTISHHPTVWIDAPQGLSENLLVEIAVREQNGQPIAKQSFAIEQNIPAGAIGISFPLKTQLQLDRTYRWEVAFYCDTEERVDSPLIVQGQIQRITPPSKLTAKSPLEMAQIFAENGIWYDALSQLGDRLATTPDRDLTTAWSELLGLAGISSRDGGSIVLMPMGR
jgi:Domain of Unknown Function (DUF928)